MSLDNMEVESYQNEGRTLLKIVGDKAVLDGKFKISHAIDVDCELKGKLIVDGKLTILQNGQVNADVKTTDAEIIGKYEGNMEASGYVEIKETGVVIGNLKTDSLIINQGAIFSGNVSRISEVVLTQKEKVNSVTAEEESKEAQKEVTEEFSQKYDESELNNYDNETEEDSLNL